MPDKTPISEAHYRELRRILARLTVGVVLLVGFVYYTSVKGRSEVVHSQRAGCESSRRRIHVLAADFTKRGLSADSLNLLGTIPARCDARYPDPGPFPLP